MIDYLETLLAEEEEWESALGLPRWPRRGRENEFLPEDRERETAPAPDAGQRGAAAEAWSLEERRRTGGEDVLETIEQAAQEMVSLTEQVRPRLRCLGKDQRQGKTSYAFRNEEGREPCHFNQICRRL